jgi:hypothetical protein
MARHLEELGETGDSTRGDRRDRLVKSDTLDLRHVHLDPIGYSHRLGSKSQKLGAFGAWLDEMDKPLSSTSEDKSREPATRSYIEQRAAGNERQKL